MTEESKLEIIEETKMEILFPRTSKAEAEEVAEFLESITADGQQEFLNFVRGANFAKRLLA